MLEDFTGLEHKVISMGAEEESRSVAAAQSIAKTGLSYSEETHRDLIGFSNSIIAPMLEEPRDIEEEERSEGTKKAEPEGSSGEVPALTRPNQPNSFDSAKVETDNDLPRDKILEQILESVQQAIGLNGQIDALRPDSVANMYREHRPSDLESKTIARNEHEPLSEFGKSMYKGDLEFLVFPRSDELELANQLDLLSEFLVALKKVPGASVLETGGSEKEGNYIIVHLENPVSLDDLMNDGMKWEEEKWDNGSNGAEVRRGRPMSNNDLEVLQRKRIRLTRA